MHMSYDNNNNTEVLLSNLNLAEWGATLKEGIQYIHGSSEDRWQSFFIWEACDGSPPCWWSTLTDWMGRLQQQTLCK